MKYKFKTKPYEHQIKALELSWKRKEFALFMEMGTGKSKVLIDTIAMQYDNGLIDSAVIVAPKGVYRNWEKEQIPLHMPEHVEHTCYVWSPNHTKKKLEELEEALGILNQLKILIVNVEAFSTAKGVNYVTKFLNANKSLLAVDESTTIKNSTAARTKNIIKISKLARARRILTGSPVTKSPLDLFSQCQFLDDYLLEQDSYYAFQNRYAIVQERTAAGGSHKYRHVMGYQRLEELGEILKRFSFRVLKSECLDLPDKVYMKREIEMTPEQKKAYDEMKQFAMTEIANETITAQSAVTILLRLHQITCGHLKKNDQVLPLKNNRVNEMLDVIEEMEGKVLIWAVYRHDIQAITKTLAEKYGPQSVRSFYGDTSDQERQEAIDLFKDDSSDLRFFVSNPRTGGYGLTFANCKNVIYYSNSYDLEVRLQSEDRTHRIGQKNTCTYVDLICEQTVDEKIVHNLKNKITMSNKILGEELKNWLV